ncbi:MAG: hypothetical protein K2R98_17370 [Gemmataceae bacterium]|nr:hypothetical protein [Gemmataceae bacterium]
MAGPIAIALLLAILNLAPGQQSHRNGFENRAPAWVKGAADTACKETVHDITEQTAHSGQFSEHIQLTCETGNLVGYYYPVGRAPVTDELSASLWVKANRPGTQLMARVVLPRERKADSINEPLTTMIRGDQYQLVGRWERLELRRPMKMTKEQQQLMRAELKRDVDFTDAYVDQLILNVYGGPGQNEIWIDDLEVGPVFADNDAGGNSGAKPPSATPTARPTASGRGSMVELNRFLQVNGKRFFFRGIRHTDTPLKTLRDAGFNTIWMEGDASPALLEEAATLGFWLVPSLSTGGHGSPALADEAIGREVTRVLQSDAVLFWDLGGGRTIEEVPLVARAAQIVHALDPQRPVGADIWDGFRPYSRDSSFLMGAHRWPLMTSLELPQYREWLNQRRNLANPGAFQWTWIQTHLPDWYASVVYDRKPEPGRKAGPPRGYDEPIGPQPEQIRLLTYTALSAGCQGLGFWSDRFLADSHQGRDRLLQLALLNQEIQMLEPLLLSMVEPPVWIDTSNAEVKAAVIRTERGLLVLPMWLGRGSQFVPGQSAMVRLSMTVPQVPGGTQAWELTPGDVRSLQTERVVGGTKVTLPEFGLTSAIVFTSDNTPTGLLVRFQDHARRTRKMAAQWSHDLAEVEIEKVLKVEAELERAGHTLPDAQALQEDARARLKTSVEHWNNGDFRQAYQESQRALRPLRILMRAQWELATKGLDSPVSSPYAVSFFTLPRHWELLKDLEHAKVEANVLPEGGFEVSPDQAPSAWLPQEVTVDEVTLAAWRVADLSEPPEKKPETEAKSTNIPPSGLDLSKPKPAAEKPKEGERCLKLQIKPKDKEHPPSALERTFLAINSPAVRLQPGTLVRISAWVRIPSPISASVDGALLYDSAGGEPLAIRMTGATGWKKYTLFRRVPESGALSVTLALTGIGTVYFDDVRIEPLVPDRTPAGATQWRR